MRILSLALLTAIASASFAEENTIRLSEPVEATESYEVFGSTMEDKSAGMSLSELVANEGEYAGQSVRVTAKINKVCQKKGCFFMAQDGQTMARVSFADYSFFIPTDASGKQVTLVGTFAKSPLSDEKAAHFAEDLGAESGDIGRDAFEYSIVASSVMIPTSG